MKFSKIRLQFWLSLQTLLNLVQILIGLQIVSLVLIFSIFIRISSIIIFISIFQMFLMFLTLNCQFLQLILKISCTLLTSLFQLFYLHINLVSILVSIICILNYISYVLFLFLQLALQSFIQLIKNLPLLLQRVDFFLQIWITCDHFVEFLLSLVQSILQNFNLIVHVFLLLLSRVNPSNLRFLFYNLFLKNPYVLRNFF